jgi:SH3-like domain-containing protein
MASFDVWRRVRTADGTEGWMSANMLSDRRTVVVVGRGRAPIHARPGGDKLAGVADPGAVANLRACERDMCEITAPGIDGWIDKSRIWGVGADEVFR